jgi:hypothetical protein
MRIEVEDGIFGTFGEFGIKLVVFIFLDKME